MEAETDNHAQLEAVGARLKAALEQFEARLEPTLKLAAMAPSLKEENAKLKFEREELKKAVHALTQKNEKLTAEIQHVSGRLDAAIEKISKVLES